jgi:hypothetical protein
MIVVSHKDCAFGVLIATVERSCGFSLRAHEQALPQHVLWQHLFVLRHK